MGDKVRVRNVITRTRTGCQTCKKRRKRCDEVRPVCGGCSRLKFSCSYDASLRWAGTGKPFIDPIDRPNPQWSVSYDFGSPDAVDSSHARLREVLQQIGATEELQRTIFVTLTERDREILLKFLTSGYRTLVSNLRIDEKFLEFFNECEQSFACLWSCLAYQVSMDSEYDDLFDEYYHRCLVLFRKEILEQGDSENNDSIWFVGMFLCGLSANRLLPWTIHLNAMITFLRSQEDLANIDPTDDELGEVLLMLGSFDISTHILNRKTEAHHIWAQYNLGLPGIEEESGVPCSLLDLFAQLNAPGTIDALFKWQVPSGEIAQIYAWNAIRYAGILRALEDSAALNGLDVATMLLQRGTSLVWVVQSLLVSIEQCLPHVLPESSHFKQTLIFPLVMASSQRNALSEESKTFICSTIQGLAMEGNFYHRQFVLNLIQEHWTNDAITIEETARRMDVELALW